MMRDVRGLDAGALALMQAVPEPDTAAVLRFLRSRPLFLLATLLLVPLLWYTALVYLHDDFHVFWQNTLAQLIAYFGGCSAVAVLLGRLTGRTRREITVVAVATIPACIVVVIGAVLYALTSDEFANLN